MSSTYREGLGDGYYVTVKHCEKEGCDEYLSAPGKHLNHLHWGFDTTAESRAWAAARNVPDDVVLPRKNGLTPWQYREGVMSEHEFLYGDQPIPGYAAHTEEAIARIAGNSIVNLDAREQAMGDLLEALAHLFDDTDPTPQSMRLTAARRAWQSWKATT